jgi:hypothetical protein
MVSRKKLKRDPWEKQPQYEPIPSNVKRWPGKKNRVKWCGGHVGREHQPETAVPHSAYGICKQVDNRGYWLWRDGWRCVHIIRCSVCGKHLKEYLSKQECPSWQAKQQRERDLPRGFRGHVVIEQSGSPSTRPVPKPPQSEPR